MTTTKWALLAVFVAVLLLALTPESVRENLRGPMAPILYILTIVVLVAIVWKLVVSAVRTGVREGTLDVKKQEKPK